MSVTVNKLPVYEDSEKSYVLLVCWTDSSFKITLLKNESSWEGTASHDHVQQLSRNIEISMEEYIQETKTALCTENGVNNFSYHVSNNQFIWKKKDQNNFRVKFGFIFLEEIPLAVATQRIVTTLLEQKCTLQKEVDTLQNENKIAQKERTVFMEKLVEYKKGKRDVEKTLYSQFLAVLNRKKESLHQIHADEPRPTEEEDSDNTTASFGSRGSPTHYESDTEPEENTTHNISGDFSFDEENRVASAIPKRTERRKRPTEPTEKKAGPRLKKTLITTPVAAVSDTNNSQDLWNDF